MMSGRIEETRKPRCRKETERCRVLPTPHNPLFHLKFWDDPHGAERSFFGTKQTRPLDQNFTTTVHQRHGQTDGRTNDSPQNNRALQSGNNVGVLISRKMNDAVSIAA